MQMHKSSYSNNIRYALLIRDKSCSEQTRLTHFLEDHTCLERGLSKTYLNCIYIRTNLDMLN